MASPDSKFVLNLKCGFCKKDLKEPEQLKCYHIFCSDCIRSSVKADGKETCPFPFCRCPRDSPQESSAASSGVNQLDIAHLAISEDPRKCPICRSTDVCDHEFQLQHLLQDEFRQKTTCGEVREHDEENIIAFCTKKRDGEKCEKLLCESCTKIKHKDHVFDDVGEVVRGNLLSNLGGLLESLKVLQKMFGDAAKAKDEAETDFEQHVERMMQDLRDRKDSLLRQIEVTFSKAFEQLEQTARKQVEQNPHQRQEMLAELQFINTAVQLAEDVLTNAEEKVKTLGGAESFQYMVEVARVWQGLTSIVNGFKGNLEQKKVNWGPDAGLPQVIVEKRLVLPAPSCVTPDLGILRKVGVENTVLRQAFYLQVETESLLFFGVVPLTQMEALVSSKPVPYSLEVVKYSDAEPRRDSKNLGEGAECYMSAAVGDGIVVTMNNAGGGGDVQNQNKVYFWDQAQGRLDGDLKLLMTTDLPPRGVAVTKDNLVVVCMATDQEPAACGILLMTLQGDLVRKTCFPSSAAGRRGALKYPLYVTVNINDDICVTDKKDKAVIILNRQLEIKHRFVNPYDRDDLNGYFSPRGICHDSFGRLIVADPDNNAVLRLEYDDAKPAPEWRVILKDRQGGVENLGGPMLVGLGHGQEEEVSRLWVVCRNIIQVFEYMDKE